MSLFWDMFSLIVDVGLLVVFLKFLVDYRRLGKRLLLAEDRVDLLERDKHKLYRKLNEVQGGGAKNKPTEKVRDQLARSSDNTSDSGSSFSYMSTMMSDNSTQSDSSEAGSYSSSDSGSSSSSSSSDSSSF